MEPLRCFQANSPCFSSAVGSNNTLWLKYQNLVQKSTFFLAKFSHSNQLLKTNVMLKLAFPALNGLAQEIHVVHLGWRSHRSLEQGHLSSVMQNISCVQCSNKCWIPWKILLYCFNAIEGNFANFGQDLTKSATVLNMTRSLALSNEIFSASHAKSA